MKKTIYPIIIVFILLFTACSGEGIFYQIQNEELIEDGSLANVKFEDIHSTGSYYIARGVKLWYRAKSSSSWDVLPLPGDALTSSAYYNGDFFYTVRDGDAAELYRIDEIDTNGPSKGGSKVADFTASTGDFVWLNLFASDDGTRMFMNVVEYDDDGDVQDSDLRYQEAGVVADITSKTDIPLCDGASLGSNILAKNGIAFGADPNNNDRTDGNAWLIYSEDGELTSGGICYSTSDNFTNTDVTTFDSVSLPEDARLASIYATITSGTDDLVMISAQTDSDEYKLFYNGDADPVSGVGSWNSVESDDDRALFDCFYDISSQVSDTVLAGAVRPSSTYSSQGYFLIDISNPGSISSSDIQQESSTLASYSNYASSDLESSSIHGIVMDESPADGSAYNILMAASKSYDEGGVWILSASDNEWEHE